MADPQALAIQKTSFQGKDMGFAFGIVVILSILFLPIPAFLIDLGLAFSIAFSVLILMVALWIKRPLDFSTFPTILLIATMAFAQHRDHPRHSFGRTSGSRCRRTGDRRIFPDGDVR